MGERERYFIQIIKQKTRIQTKNLISMYIMSHVEETEHKLCEEYERNGR